MTKPDAINVDAAKPTSAEAAALETEPGEVDAAEKEPELSVDQLRRRVVRLERRLSRERSAREAAEQIADDGMRELWLTNRALDQRVSERTADLAATLEELEVATSTRDRFLSTLSHEMRTPLNGVLGMLELLSPHVPDEQGQTYLKTAGESAEGLHRLVKRLLDLVELDTGQLELNECAVALDEFTNDIRARWQRRAMHAGSLLTVTSFFDADAVAVFDRARVNQILDELVANAISHAKPGTLRVKAQPMESTIVVEVEDCGPGPTGELLNLSKPEFSVDMSTARLNQGLGIGLSLSRQLATVLGGDLQVASEGPGKTAARLTLPHQEPVSNV